MKFCINCVYSQKSSLPGNDDIFYCLKTATPNVVTGKPEMKFCSAERIGAYVTSCGPTAKFFEERPNHVE